MTSDSSGTGPVVQVGQGGSLARSRKVDVERLTPLLERPSPADPYLLIDGKRRGRPTTQTARSRPAPRRRILDRLIATPGLHLRALQRSLGIELSTLEHHLDVLRRDGQAASHSFGHYKAFYPIAGLDRNDWEILFFLHQEQPSRILILLADDRFADQARVAAVLGVSAATCSFHLKKLCEAGLLDRERFGAHTLWSLREPRHVLDVISRHMPAEGTHHETHKGSTVMGDPPAP